MEDLITIVVPVYKVEKYIDRCVTSILNQTYKNLQIILVDDGSPDNCGKICDEYAKKDNRIEVIHKENGGLSDARNAGINIAKGKYIAFVDSDDYVSNDYIEYMYKILKKENAKISICELQIVWKNTKIEENIKIDENTDAEENLNSEKNKKIEENAKLEKNKKIKQNKENKENDVQKLTSKQALENLLYSQGIDVSAPRQTI